MSDAEMRISDAEREHAADALREHFAAGRIREDELSERLDAVYAARTERELQEVMRELPVLAPSPAASRAELAERRREVRRHLLQQAGGATIPFAVATLIWAASGAQSNFWPVWLLVFPVIFLVRNGWRLYGPAPEIDRVHAELTQRGSRRGGRPRGGRHSLR